MTPLALEEAESVEGDLTQVMLERQLELQILALVEEDLGLLLAELVGLGLSLLLIQLLLELKPQEGQLQP